MLGEIFTYLNQNSSVWVTLSVLCRITDPSTPHQPCKPRDVSLGKEEGLCRCKQHRALRWEDFPG